MIRSNMRVSVLKFSVLFATSRRLASSFSYISNKKHIFTMTKSDIKGIIATAFTPFNSDENRTVNLPLIPKIAELFKNEGFKYVLINGTYGEGMSMTTDERIEVADEWAKAVKKTEQELIVQVGGTNLQDVKKLARHAESMKVKALLCLPELYYKPRTVEELVDYLKEVGEAAPNTLLFYYHSPLATGVTLAMHELFSKVKGQVPSFAGVKFAVAQLDDLSRAMREAGDEYQIIMASNHNIPLYRKMGIDTFMPTAINVDAAIVRKIYEYSTEDINKYKQAQTLQKYFSILIDRLATLNDGNVAPIMKARNRLPENINYGPSRKPTKSFNTLEDQKKIDEIICKWSSKYSNN